MKQVKVHLALICVSFFYAILFSWAGNIMPKYLPPTGFVFLRIVTAAILFFAFARFFITTKTDIRSDWKLFLLCGFFGTSANMVLFFIGLNMTRPINGAVLMMVTPLFVALFDHIKNRRKPSMDTVVGFLLATAGASLLIAGKGIVFTRETLTGDLLIAINAVFFAVYLVLVKGLVAKYHSMQVNSITFLVGAILVAPIGLLPLMKTNFSQIPADIWMKIGYILLFTTFVVYQLNAYAVQNASPQLVGAYIYLQPVLATLIAVLLGQDSISPVKAAYIGMILGGVWLVAANKSQVISRLKTSNRNV